MSNIYPNCNKINKIMETRSLAENSEKVTLDWNNSLSVQRLLDVISCIIAEEYIAVAKQNPVVFSKIASPPSGVRNDTFSNYNGGR